MTALSELYLNQNTDANGNTLLTIQILRCRPAYVGSHDNQWEVTGRIGVTGMHETLIVKASTPAGAAGAAMAIFYNTAIGNRTFNGITYQVDRKRGAQ